MSSQETSNSPLRQSFLLWRKLVLAMAYGSVAVMLSMMLLTFTDVFARYVFNRPISGAFELTEIGLAMVVFLAMPLTTLSKEHVEVDLLPIPKKSKRAIVLPIIAVAIITTVFSLAALEIWEETHKLLRRGKVTNSLSLPLYPVAAAVAISCAVSALSAIFTLFEGADT